MAVSAEFLDFIKEQLSGFGPVTIRRMFGGGGVFRDGLMFALIADEVHFKADERSQADFEAISSAPFVYGAKGGNTVMSYWRAPELCMDDPDEMAAWAEKAYAAALCVHKPAKPKASAKRPRSRRS